MNYTSRKQNIQNIISIIIYPILPLLLYDANRVYAELQPHLFTPKVMSSMLSAQQPVI